MTHVTLILTTFRYFLSWLRMNYYGGMAQFCYRTSFIAAALTYGIVVYKSQRASAKAGNKSSKGFIGFYSDENVLYLFLALVWLISPQYPLALLPYSIYSVFHIATYTRYPLIATITPPPADNPKKDGPLAQKISDFSKQNYASSMSIVSALEILLWFRVFLAAIFFQRRSWILITLYTVFLRARYSESPHLRESFALLSARVDSLVGAQGTPPAARQVWETLKNGVRQFHDASDVKKYVQGTAAKKSS
ncbi:Transmembrane nucleoporin [Amphichorda felina]